MKKRTRIIISCLFALYCIVMLYLLYFRGRHTDAWMYKNYWQMVKWSVNLVPIKTVNEFLSRLDSNGNLAGHALMNLAGNIVMFVPLGVFLPLLWEKLRSYGSFILRCALIIIAVEITQLFTLMGSGDIDDLILNLLGASIGFCIYKAAWALHKRKKEKAQ